MASALKRRLTGNTVERIRLRFESGIGDLSTAATTNTIRMLTQGGERMLDSTKLFDRAHLHRPGDIDLMVCSGLVDRVRKKFRFRRDQVGHHGFVCEHRSKFLKLALKSRVLHDPSHLEVRVFRRNNS